MRSLRLKLIVGSLLVLAAVILAFDIFVYAAKRHTLFEVMDGRLYAQTQAVSRYVEIEGEKPALDPAQENAARPPLPVIFRVVGEGGAVLAQSLLSGSVPWLAAGSGGPNPQWRSVGPGRGGTWRVATWTGRLERDAQVVDPSASPGEVSMSVIVQCAEPLASVSKELRELASLLALVSLATFLIAGGGSFWLAGRALRPIRRVNAALETVSETRLDQRLDPFSFDVELHPLITQLNAALDRLERGFQRERQFTADASHELRTPLAAILNSIEVLLRRPRTEEELIDAHLDNERTARSMQAVVEGLLLLARMDAGKGPPAKENVEAAALVEEIFAALGFQARAKNVRLVQAVDPSIRVQAAPSQLRLALANLIDNAVRYNRPDGSVTVEARQEDGATVIEVRDTGPGIPAEHLPRLFERFYRVDPSRAETTGGAGLGLSIVRKIVEGQGGHVSASSGPEGSVFRLVFPINRIKIS